MNSTLQNIRQRFQETFQKILPPEFHNTDPLIRITEDANFGDYQSNVAMSLAKALKKPPRQVAQEIVDHLNVGDIFSSIELAGPGFINMKLNAAYLASLLESLKNDSRLGIAPVKNQMKHIIDFSSPNLAKEMHVGHLRTTITGEVIARILEFEGHDVERVNHVGDWGTQFGMLLEYIQQNFPDVIKNPEALAIQDLETFYKAAKQSFDADSEFADRARLQVVKLQSGDETARKIWQGFLKESLRHCHEIYKVLGVKLTDLGESFYNDRLPVVVDELIKLGLAVESQGAVCVFPEGFTNRDGEPMPMIIRKSDGGYNYDTTDLAAIKYRIFERAGKRLIYITDIRQAQHFAMLFATARKAGWASSEIQLDHVGYGMVLGQDRKPFKTRDGGTVRLKHLLEESIARARATIESGKTDANGELVRNYSPEQADQIANAVGLAAIKYFDLSHSLSSDYVFNWEQMLAMEGNTGPYMLYAYARIKSIGRKAGRDLDQLSDAIKLHLEHPSELALAKILIQFPDVIQTVSKDLKPNILTDYLYQLSKIFNSFYDKKTGVKVIDENPQMQNSRLLLCHLTVNTLKLGLHLLSIETVEQM